VQRVMSPIMLRIIVCNSRKRAAALQNLYTDQCVLK